MKKLAVSKGGTGQIMFFDPESFLDSGSQCQCREIEHQMRTWSVSQSPLFSWFTETYCLVTEARVCEQLAQGCYLVAERP